MQLIDNLEDKMGKVLGADARFVKNPDIVREMDAMVGQVVIVTWSRKPLKSNGFHTALSVEGKLERHPVTASWRVMVSDSNYAYIEEPSHVMAIMKAQGEKRKHPRIFVA